MAFFELNSIFGVDEAGFKSDRTIFYQGIKGILFPPEFFSLAPDRSGFSWTIINRIDPDHDIAHFQFR